ncbi:MAG: hypothetical protein NVSMB37_6680 [Candidatus Saccharimonadales bacterium]
MSEKLSAMPTEQTTQQPLELHVLDGLSTSNAAVEQNILMAPVQETPEAVLMNESSAHSVDQKDDNEGSGRHFATPTPESIAENIKEIGAVIKEVNKIKKGQPSNLSTLDEVKRDWKGGETAAQYEARLTVFSKDLKSLRTQLKQEQAELVEKAAKVAADAAEKHARNQKIAVYKLRDSDYNAELIAHKEAVEAATEKALFKSRINHGAKYTELNRTQIIASALEAQGLQKTVVAREMPVAPENVAQLDGSVTAERRSKKEASTNEYAALLKAADKAMLVAAAAASAEILPSAVHPKAEAKSEPQMAEPVVPTNVKVIKSKEQPSDLTTAPGVITQQPELVKNVVEAPEESPQERRSGRLVRGFRGAKLGLAGLYAAAGVRVQNAQNSIGKLIHDRENLTPEDAAHRRKIIGGLAGAAAVTGLVGIAYVTYKMGHGHHASHQFVAKSGGAPPNPIPNGHESVVTAGLPAHTEAVGNVNQHAIGATTLHPVDSSAPWSHFAQEVGPGNATARITELVSKAGQHGWKINGNGLSGGHGAIVSIVTPEGKIFTDNSNINAALDLIASL